MILKISSSQYPPILKKIKNPPKTLYVAGNTDILNNPCLAIVGTRKPTEYGIKVAKEFSKNLSSKGITIISGLAEGIDSYAHIASKSEKGKTIAVLGGGVNKVFPKQNARLAKEIIEEGGCIVSEYPPEEEAKMENFPGRNRIISGLSVGVLIVEARYRSGSSITARYAVEQKKEVFCVPRDIYEKTGYVTNEYIKNGAHLVTNIEDILEYYPDQKEEVIPREYEEIYRIINDDPITVDEICKFTNLSPAGINEKLILMEIEGLIQNVNGGYIRVVVTG